MEKYKVILVSIKSEKVETVKKRLKKYSDDADAIIQEVINGSKVQILIDSEEKCIACKNNLEEDEAAVVTVEPMQEKV